LSTRLGSAEGDGAGTAARGSAASVLAGVSATDELLARTDERVARVRGGRLGVHAHERLRPRRPDEQPRAIVDEELEAVVGGEGLCPDDLLAGKIGRWRVDQLLEQPPLRLRAAYQIGRASCRERV